jgi:hypothetical protein
MTPKHYVVFAFITLLLTFLWSVHHSIVQSVMVGIGGAAGCWTVAVATTSATCSITPSKAFANAAT